MATVEVVKKAYSIGTFERRWIMWPYCCKRYKYSTNLKNEYEQQVNDKKNKGMDHSDVRVTGYKPNPRNEEIYDALSRKHIFKLWPKIKVPHNPDNIKWQNLGARK